MLRLAPRLTLLALAFALPASGATTQPPLSSSADDGRTRVHAPPPARDEPGALAPPTWASCPDRAEGAELDRPLQGLLLGRYSQGTAVLEVGSSGEARLAKLWSHSFAGGVEVGWPGGRRGVRHLADPKLWPLATRAAKAGRLYFWSSAQGWNGGEVAPIIGVELAKSLCDARDLVVYVVLKVPVTGHGFGVGSILPPPASADGPPDEPPDAPKAVMDRIYTSLTAELEAGVKAQKLAPASLAVNVFPGHFSAAAEQYAVSLRWSNAFDDRFSLLYLADATGKLTRLIDRQEGAAGATLVECADLDGDGLEELFYELTTLDGSTAALWSLRNGTARPLVQTTPVGE